MSGPTPSTKRGLTLSGVQHVSFQHGDETWLLWSNGMKHQVEKIPGRWTPAQLGLVVRRAGGERMSRPDNTRCECGHPEASHPQPPAPPWARPCRATVYETVPNGMNARPCPCKNFRRAGGDG